MEVHGWIALATSNDAWDNENFSRAFDEIARLVSELPRDRGYSGVVGETERFPQVVYIKAIDAYSLNPLDGFIESVSKVFDSSYGELAISSNESHESDWHSSSIKRYTIKADRLEPISAE